MIEEFCAGRVIWKTRYRRAHADYLWEIDDLQGDNAGLIIAEVELSTADEQTAAATVDWPRGDAGQALLQ